MKKRMLQVLVVVLLVVLALSLRNRGRLPETPEKTVSEFFAAAGNGDDRAYLRLVTGELRKSLENARSQAGVEAFRNGLRRSAAGIKGLAVSRADETPDLVTLDLELVFADRNERQRMLLEATGGGWAIRAIEAAEMLKPPIAYGTPVFEEPKPEEREGQK
ncbi:MAG: hypothetical protein ABIP48_25605 [Planctomycetota bacterium]